MRAAGEAEPPGSLLRSRPCYFLPFLSLLPLVSPPLLFLLPPPLPRSPTMSFPQLGYQYIRPLYPAERPGSGGSRGGAELAPSGTLSNVLSSMYGAPYAAAAAAQGYGAFLPYAAELPIFPQLVRGPRGSPLAPRGARFALGIGRGGAGGHAGRAVRGETGAIAALPRRAAGEGHGWNGGPAASSRSARGLTVAETGPSSRRPRRGHGGGEPVLPPRHPRAPAGLGLAGPQRARDGRRGAPRWGRQRGPAAAPVPTGSVPGNGSGTERSRARRSISAGPPLPSRCRAPSTS